LEQNPKAPNNLTMLRSTGRTVVRGRSTDFLWIERSLVRDLILATVGASATLVYVVLASNADPQGLCVMSMAFLTHQSGMTPKTVRKAVRTLEAAGLVALSPQPMAATAFHLLPIA
jgi:hypothetical protein